MVFLVTRAYYEQLLESGVKIYEYTPGFIHSKTFVCDDKLGIVGTINLDYRSLFLHYECGVWMYQTSAIAKLRITSIRLANARRSLMKRRGAGSGMYA